MANKFTVYVPLPDAGVLTDMDGRPSLCVEVEKALNCGWFSDFRKLEYKVLWQAGVGDGNRYRIDLVVTTRFKDPEQFERVFREKTSDVLPYTATMEEPSMVEARPKVFKAPPPPPVVPPPECSEPERKRRPVARKQPRPSKPQVVSPPVAEKPVQEKVNNVAALRRKLFNQ